MFSYNFITVLHTLIYRWSTITNITIYANDLLILLNSGSNTVVDAWKEIDSKVKSKYSRFKNH